MHRDEKCTAAWQGQTRLASFRRRTTSDRSFQGRSRRAVRSAASSPPQDARKRRTFPARSCAYYSFGPRPRRAPQTEWMTTMPFVSLIE